MHLIAMGALFALPNSRPRTMLSIVSTIVFSGLIPANPGRARPLVGFHAELGSVAVCFAETLRMQLANSREFLFRRLVKPSWDYDRIRGSG
jgi:hypothetical protein